MLRVESVETSGSILQSWFFCLLYCGISFPLFYAFALKDRVELMGALIGGFFAVWGVVYFWVTFQKTLEYLKFGRIFLQLQHKPALGGVLAGSVRAIGVGLHPVELDLSASEETFDTDSKGRQVRREKFVWRRLHKLSGKGGRIEFSIPVPDAPEIERGVTYVWKLRVRADMPGADLDRSFALEIAQGQGREVSSAPAAAMLATRVAQPVLGPATQGFAVSPPTPQPVGDLTADTAARSVALPPPLSAPILIAANLLLLVGVLYWEWSVPQIVVLYWVENLVIGAIHVLRILCASPEGWGSASSAVQSTAGERMAAKIGLAGFFVVHYGAFCAAHGSFLGTLFPVRGLSGAELEIWQLLTGMLREPGSLAAIGVLVASHGYSFARNYLGRGEYRRVNVGMMMLRPYGRIFVVHLFVIAGGLLLQGYRATVAALLLFIALKTGIDYAMHRRERRLLSP